MAVILGTSGNDNLNGTPDNDGIFGFEGDDSLNGLGGNDQLNGGDGKDFLDGGEGSDTLIGNTGDDRYFVDSGDTVVELAGEGADIVYARTSFALTPGAYVELLATINFQDTTAIDLTGNEIDQAVTGNNGNNYLQGLGGNDYLRGLAGDDYLDGGTGNDTMVGGTGNDIYIVDSGSDQIIEAEGEGLDYAFASTNYVLTHGAQVELLGTTNSSGTTAIDLTGNEQNNAIVGNEGNNTLTGGGGDDHLSGLGGNDYLDGGTGSDTMVGGTGNDIYLVDSNTDIVRENVGEGFDSVYTTASFVLTAGSEVEVLAVRDATTVNAINLTGNAFNNSIQGNDGANAIDGGQGDDSISGLGGADVLIGDLGADLLTGGTGNDVFTYLLAIDSAPGSADRITDFVSGADKIDLSAIDANSTTEGTNEAFTFIGTGAFTNQAGQLRYEVDGSQMHVYGDTNGDGIADLHIIVNGTILTGGDFIP
ncbi:calcium-binding protein [Allosphingosinicella sp.]|jgi:Ca2+-binding RTX toxin-like protein|uniref:calcium-binding protein n=1 Tax=Allosphingosinicella sp. TaxID=2823234 RepID=UPI002EFEC183